MRIGILGHMGSIGSRHLANLISLGITTGVYDVANYPEHHRQIVINESDAIIIASPTEHHLRDLGDSLTAGKHVFIEKPIATKDSPLLRELLKNAKSANRIIFVGNNLRYHACIKLAKEKLLSLVILLTRDYL